jgi:hypothetical protein
MHNLRNARISLTRWHSFSFYVLNPYQLRSAVNFRFTLSSSRQGKRIHKSLSLILNKWSTGSNRTYEIGGIDR